MLTLTVWTHLCTQNSLYVHKLRHSARLLLHRLHNFIFHNFTRLKLESFIQVFRESSSHSGTWSLAVCVFWIQVSSYSLEIHHGRDRDVNLSTVYSVYLYNCHLFEKDVFAVLLSFLPSLLLLLTWSLSGMARLLRGCDITTNPCSHILIVGRREFRMVCLFKSLPGGTSWIRG